MVMSDLHISYSIKATSIDAHAMFCLDMNRKIAPHQKSSQHIEFTVWNENRKPCVKYYNKFNCVSSPKRTWSVGTACVCLCVIVHASKSSTFDFYIQYSWDWEISRMLPFIIGDDAILAASNASRILCNTGLDMRNKSNPLWSPKTINGISIHSCSQVCLHTCLTLMWLAVAVS